VQNEAPINEEHLYGPHVHAKQMDLKKGRQPLTDPQSLGQQQRRQQNPFSDRDLVNSSVKPAFETQIPVRQPSQQPVFNAESPAVLMGSLKLGQSTDCDVDHPSGTFCPNKDPSCEVATESRMNLVEVAGQNEQWLLEERAAAHVLAVYRAEPSSKGDDPSAREHEIWAKAMWLIELRKTVKGA
jgi:hypothetical protein